MNRPLLSARIFAACWIFLLLLVVMLEAARLVMWVGHGSIPDAGWLLRGLLRGGRYDLAIGGSLTLLVLLLTLPLLALPRIGRIAPNLAFALCIGLLGICTLLATSEYYYYGFYHTRFDPVVFGLFEDDTVAVLQTVWNDYPVVTGTLAVAALLFLAYKALRWASGRLSHRLQFAGYQGIALAIAQVLALALLARGTLGTFPLVRQDVLFAQDPFVNQIVLNAPLTLYKAYKTRGKDIDLGDDPRVGLRRWGFATPQEAAAVLGVRGDDTQIADALFARVPPRNGVLLRKPHVVLALLESFGTDLLDADGGSNDLLGRLRPHLRDDYLFPNFFAAQNGTHPALEALLLGSPITPLTRGRYADVAYPTSAALPFKQAGYRTAFIYAGGASWRNLRRTFLHQGFDHVYDAADIRAKFPATQGNEWGVYDEYVFAYARDLLAQAERDGQPLFLFLLTTTNHPPFNVPAGARTQFDPARLGSRAAPDTAALQRMMATYRYQADQLGGFMDWLTRGPLGDHAIVAATGDHNLRSHYIYALPQEQPDVDRVLGYFHLPAPYRPAQVDTQRFGGHADILPTLAAVALPDARYCNFGRDLLAPAQADDHALSRFHWLYQPDGVVEAPEQPAFHAWTDRARRRIAANGHAPSPQEASAARRVAARVALQDWLIRRSALGTPARRTP
ncbi:LTA synthase family protein [Lysobacter tyrosinilyticus]